MSRFSGFPEAFVHAALFCCPAHMIFGSPSPGHGEEGLLPAGTNKALGTHEQQWPGCNFALYAGCITNCICRRLWDGGYTAGMAVLRGLRAAGAVLLAGAALFM